MRRHEADLMLTDAAINEIARIALGRGTGARGLRAVVEEVLEAVMYDAEAGVMACSNRGGGQGWGTGQAQPQPTDGTVEQVPPNENNGGSG